LPLESIAEIARFSLLDILFQQQCKLISSVGTNGYSEQSEEAERKKELVIEEIQSIKSRILTV